MRGPAPRPRYRLASRSIEDGLPTTLGGWALLVAKAAVGTVLVWAWLVLFILAFS